MVGQATAKHVNGLVSISDLQYFPFHRRGRVCRYSVFKMSGEVLSTVAYSVMQNVVRDINVFDLAYSGATDNPDAGGTRFSNSIADPIKCGKERRVRMRYEWIHVYYRNVLARQSMWCILYRYMSLYT